MMSSADQPLVSVICGFFNREEGVEVSLPSIVNQSYKNLEVIVFDDCSTDSTLSRLQRFASVDKRIKVIAHEKNIGFVNGLINAISISSGEFVCIHGAGDESLPSRIEEQVKYLQSNENVAAVSVYSSYKRVVKDDWYVRRTKFGNIVTKEIINDNPIVHGAVTMRRDMYEVVGGYRPFFKYSQDRDLWTRLSLRFQVHVMPVHLYVTYPSKNGVSVVNRTKILQKYYSKFVNQLIEMRIKDGRDFVDIFGDDAKFFMNPLPPIKNFRKMAIKQLYHERISELVFLITVIKHTDKRLKTRVFLRTLKMFLNKTFGDYMRSLAKAAIRRLYGH